MNHEIDAAMTRAGLEIAMRLLDAPPRRLSEFEAIVGSIGVDFAREGMGSISRPEEENDPPLPAGLLRLLLRYDFDIHHDEPRRPRDLVFATVDYFLSADRSALEAALIARFGGGRDVVDERGLRWREHGPFYLHADAGPVSRLHWERERPEWAHPAVSREARRAFLRALVSAVRWRCSKDAICARVKAHLEAAGVTAEPRTRDGRPAGLRFAFVPMLACNEMLDAFGWERAVAVSTDVHMTKWHVVPESCARARVPAARIGRWIVWPCLAGRPRGERNAELDARPEIDPSAYDVARCSTRVRSIDILPEQELR